MAWRLPHFRFSLRTLLLAVLLCAVGSWLYTNRPERRRAVRNLQARQRIDPYELSIAGDGNPRNVPPELVAVLGDSRLKHWSRVIGVEILAGNQVASRAHDGKIRIWDANTGRQLHQFLGFGLAVSGDRKRAFFSTTEGTIRCWDVAGGRVVKTLGVPGSPESVGMAANDDGSVLVTESHRQARHREIIVWDVANETKRTSFIADKPGGGAMAVTRDGETFTWEYEGQIQVTETAGGVVRKIGPLDGRPLLGEVKFSADETKLYVGSARRSVMVFDFKTGEHIKEFGNARGSVHTFALGPGEKSIVFGGQPSLTVQQRFHDDWVHWEGDVQHERDFGWVDWHGELIAAGNDRAVSLWSYSATAGLHPWRLQGGRTSAIRALAFHPDGRRLFTGNSAGEIAAIEVGTWKHLKTWQAHGGAIATLGVSRDGARLLTSAADHTLSVWDAASYREISLLRDIHFYAAAGISPDGQHVAAHPRGRISGNQFEVSAADRGSHLRFVGPIDNYLTCPPVWSPDGQRVAFTDTSRVLKIFGTQDWRLESSTGKFTVGAESPSIVWFADSKRLLTAGLGGNDVHVLAAGQSTPLVTINAGVGRVRAVALHPSEQWAAFCGDVTPAQLAHLATGRVVKTWQIGPPDGVVSQVAFSPDGHYLATLNGNGTVYVLSLDGMLTP